ncbi:MAG: hypothetical protein KDK23_11910 [Leptospiraceae bacterium]|nr:hypothetical protein [Leptospiraceae bacterium]
MSSPAETNPSRPDVADLQESTEFVQALEARGDFKYKGIFALFNTMLDWTNRFDVNRILPGMDQLKKEVTLPEDKFMEFLRELLGRGSSKLQCAYCFPALDFVSGSRPGLSQLVVFCRPGKKDHNSARRYVDFYQEKTIQALSRWIDSRDASWDDERFQFLETRADQGHLNDTHAGSEIARFLVVPFDKTAEEKKTTYNRFARPVIQALIDQRKLVYLEDAKVGYRTVLIPDRRNLGLRLDMLFRYAKTRIVKEMSTESYSQEVCRQLVQKATGQTMPRGHGQVIAEMRLILPLLEQKEKEEKEKEKKEKISKSVSDLQKIQKVVPASHFNWDEEHLQTLQSNPAVLSANMPRGSRLVPYVLHKENLEPAIKAARDLLDQKGEDLEVHILSEMGVERFLDGEKLKSFEGLEQRSLFKMLPWFRRLWRQFFGGRKLKKTEMVQLKNQLRKEFEQEKLRIQKSEARRKQKELVEERLKGEEEQKAEKAKRSHGGVETASADNAQALMQQDVEKSKERMELDEQAKQNLDRIGKVLDEAWDRGELPNRTHVVEQLKDFDEDSLVMFLKKHGRKEVYSFRVRNDDPKYVWPILISKKYIQRHGRRLYKEAMEAADQQRKASMPNQEKFDVATAKEDFFGRIFARSR